MTEPHDEVQELRETIRQLEAELARMRQQVNQQKNQQDESPTDEAETVESEDTSSESKRFADAAKTVSDEMNRLSLGLAYGGLESLSVTADAARFFVDKVNERNSNKDRKSVAKQMMLLPWDVTAALVDTLEQYANKNRRVVDKFYQKYNEDSQ